MKATTGSQLDWVDEAVAELPSIVTVSEAIAVLRCSRRHLYRHVSRGRIHAVRPEDSGSSRLLIPRREIARFLRSLEVTA